MNQWAKTPLTEIYRCPRCGRCYKAKTSLRRHLVVECGKPPGHKCPYCDHRSKYRASMSKHVMNIHPSLPYPKKEVGRPDESFRATKWPEARRSRVGPVLTEAPSSFLIAEYAKMRFFMSGGVTEDRRRSRGQGRFACDNCDRRYHQMKNLRRHVINECAEQQYPLASVFKHTCGTCGKTYKHKHHLKRHHDFECGIDPKFKCAFCPHRTRYKNSLMKHILARHQHLLDQNAAQYGPQQVLDVHGDIQGTMGYSPANWTVPALPSTSRVAAYTRHLRSMTLRDRVGKVHRWTPRKYACTACDRNFALMASLTRHRAFECDGQPPLAAERIDQEISPERKRKKKYGCPNCDRQYAVFTSLWRHRHYECGVEPKFSCPICKFKFTQKGNLDRHIRSKH
nr:zinc finger protein 689-like [Megalopta genalis]